MGKRISELPAVTALGDSDVIIANHIDTSEQEPVTATSKITVANLKQTLGINGKVDTSDIGAANGVAELDGNGKIPSAQLPGYVDDVIEGYYDAGTDRFYTESTFEHVIPPASDISWVDIAANKSYRWTGSAYVRVDEGVQLGETSGSAYRGDRGKTAYDHSQTTSGNPHNVSKSDVGLGNVANTGDSDTPVSGGTTKFTTGGAYTELNKKADKVTGGATGNFAALDSSGNLVDSGSKASDFLTSHQDISGKADKVSGATAGDVATLDANGNLVDSGKILGVSVPSNAVFTDMAGADASYNGSRGYVPAPSAGDQDKVLSGAGIWVPQSSGGSGKADITAIGTEEAGATASKAYSTGDRFYKNGKFCTAIASIAQGATFTLNTNYVEGTIADAITSLNSQLVAQVTFTPDSTSVNWFNRSAYQFGKIIVINLWCQVKNNISAGGSITLGTVNKLPAYDYVYNDGTKRSSLVSPMVSGSTGNHIGHTNLNGETGVLTAYLPSGLESLKSINATVVYRTS